MLEDVVGCKINKLKYQGNNIFTLNLENGENKYSLNFIGCFILHDTGCVGNTITQIDIGEPGIMGMAHLHACDKLGLVRAEHFSAYIATLEEHSGAKCEIYLAAKAIELVDSEF